MDRRTRGRIKKRWVDRVEEDKASRSNNDDDDIITYITTFLSTSTSACVIDNKSLELSTPPNLLGGSTI